jgi:hypothetical protein
MSNTVLSGGRTLDHINQDWNIQPRHCYARRRRLNRATWGGQYIFGGKQSRAGASLQPTIHSGSRRPELNSAVACTPIAHVVALLRRETKRRVVLPGCLGNSRRGL